MASIEKTKGGYRVRVRVKGQPCASATLKTRQQAERWAARTEADMCEMRYFGDSYKMTLADLIDRYIEREAPLRLKESSMATMVSCMQSWKAALGCKYIAHIRPRDILEVRDALMLRHASSTVNRMISNLSSVFAYAVEREYCASNPCTCIKALAPGKRRARVLTVDEESRLIPVLRDIDADTCDTVLFALATGARKSEVLKLRVADVSFSVRAVTFKDTKNGSDRTVPVSQHWADRLSDIMAHGGFKFRYASWIKALDMARVEDITLHDLRHTFVTRAIASGHNPMHVAAMVGHSSQTMVQYYTHLGVDDLRGLIQS